ncbi:MULTISPECIES: thioester domain-containing protein [unclassified Streptomyces]|uniref:thioester domain-containing protein n=1 Tax=unclassified Streptomyces TaxID=2593676 RepID=UPI000A6263EE|nr:thioester domain-containing protein [Streptomyces sp. CNQ-509]
MTSVRRPSHRRSARLTAAVLAAGLATAGAIAGAAPAAAQDAPPANGATATLGGLTIKDTAIVDGGKEIGAGLFEMAVDEGGTIQTYCIDFGNPTQPEAKYQEVPWSASSLQNNPDAGKINWILQNSYPQVDDLSALAAAAGAGELTENTAAAGTQIAIWRFSDKVNVEAKDPEAEKLADYLEAGAEAIEEPAPSLNLGPTAVSGKSGEKLGPVTVNTDAAEASLSLSPEAESAGVKVVDADGKALTSASDGAEVFLDVPAGTPDGSATLTAQATTQVPVGRAFAGVGEHAKSQTQILAGSSDTTVTAQATANWASEGPIPALSADKNCAKGGVDVTAENKGDQPFSFELAGESHTVAPGESKTVLVEVAEDQAYEITINGDDGFSEKFTGVLDCETAGNDTPAPSEPSPASAGGSAGGDDAGDDEGGDLANTGGSSATPVIAGVAIGLVVVGGATVFLLRRRGSGADAA